MNSVENMFSFAYLYTDRFFPKTLGDWVEMKNTSKCNISVFRSYLSGYLKFVSLCMTFCLTNTDKPKSFLLPNSTIPMTLYTKNSKLFKIIDFFFNFENLEILLFIFCFCFCLTYQHFYSVFSQFYFVLHFCIKPYLSIFFLFLHFRY